MAAQESTLLNAVLSQPELVAIGLALLGVIAARMLRVLMERGLAALNRVLSRTSAGRGAPLSERVIRLLGTLTFWAVLVITALLVLRTLGTGRVFTWIDVPLAYVPRVIVGLFIIGAAHLLGVASRNLVQRLQGDSQSDRLAPRLVQSVILVLGVITGLQHVGLNVSFVADLLMLVIGVSLAGLSLAFALGARQYVANLIARSTVMRFAPGDRIRIDGIDGRVVEIHRSGIDLSTPEGIVTVPAARFAETTVLRREDTVATEEP